MITHSHQDHLDPETLAAYRNAGGRGPYLPLRRPGRSCTRWESRPAKLPWSGPIKKLPWAISEFAPLSPSRLGGDDLTHVGYIVFVKDGPTVYFTGDSGFEELLAIAVEPHKPDVLVTVINGAFGIMGPAEAAILARKLGVKVVIPCHHDLFPDNCLPPQLLHTNLKLQGIGDRYRLLRHGEPFDYRL